MSYGLRGEMISIKPPSSAFCVLLLVARGLASSSIVIQMLATLTTKASTKFLDYLVSNLLKSTYALAS